MKKFTVKYTSQCKKDIKRFVNNKTKLSIFKDFIEDLEYDRPLPENSRPHLLSHQYNGCWECQMQGDFLLIWRDPVNFVITVVRVGSHSELFDM